MDESRAAYQDDWRWIELEVAESPTRIIFAQRTNEKLRHFGQMDVVDYKGSVSFFC